MKALEDAEQFTHASRIFDDWIALVDVSLAALPAHVEAAMADRTLAADTPETAALFKRIMVFYRDRAAHVIRYFALALGTLLDVAHEHTQTNEYRDVIGDVYMRLNAAKSRAGQYFTPWNLARMIADMTIADGERRVMERLLHGNPLWLLLSGKDPAPVPFEPVTVHDPACGSGALLLAAATRFPRWMLTRGLVQFSGVDIDATCVTMARINMRLYGLNGTVTETLQALQRGRTRAVDRINSELSMLPHSAGPVTARGRDNTKREKAR